MVLNDKAMGFCRFLEAFVVVGIGATAGILYAVVGAGGSALRMLKEGGKIGTARQTVIFSSMRLNGWNGWPPGDREKLKEK